MQMHDSLSDRIRPVMRKLRSQRFWRLIACFAFLTGLAALTIYLQGDQSGLINRQMISALWMIAAASLVIAILVSAMSYRNPRMVARAIESQFPSLKQRLLTALSQSDQEELGYLQQRVIREARDHSRTHRWTDVVPAGQMFLSRLSGLAATRFHDHDPGFAGGQ